MNRKKRAANKDLRLKFFASDFFLSNYKPLVKEAVEALNERRNVHYHKYTTQELEFFIKIIIPNEKFHKQIRKGTIETKELIARRSTMFDVLHNKLITIQKLPEDQEQQELDTFFLQEPSIIPSIDEFKKLMIVFQRLIEDKAVLKQSTAKLQVQAEATNEIIAKLTQEVKISNDKAAAAELIIQERNDRREKVKNRVRKELNNAIRHQHYEELLEKIGSEQRFFKAPLGLGLTILFVTGIGVEELRNVKLKDVQTLFTKQKPHIKIETAKKRPKRSAFMTEKGKNYIKTRRKDFDLIYQ